jgi:beta-galactosidase GanA
MRTLSEFLWERDMAEQDRFGIPGVPFPIGVEYYRPPTPVPEVWDADFARIRAAGLDVVRTFPYWQWFEPSPGNYEFDDIDRLFDTAAKHDLYIWLDVPTATHGAGPDWLLRDYPDMRVINYRNEPVMQDAHPAYAQGAQVHCIDHPAFRDLSGRFLRHAINRYKDRPNLLVWGIWDGPNLSSAWATMGGGYPCYCAHTLAKYKSWLRERFTLDQLNEKFDRRFRRWEDVEPPRSDLNVVEMRWYRRFHHEDIADYLQWMIDLANEIDPVHEKRAHGGWTPQPKDEYCAPIVDSWGMSMSANHLLTADDPNLIADRAFGFDWSRSVGRNGRWWNEEIYAGMSRGGVTWKKQSHPNEQTTLLWMTLIGGAAGAMFWQYRPEYLSFESPGYNMVALDGEPTPRFRAVTRTIEQIEGIREHLPMEIPAAEVAIVYDAHSHELFQFNDAKAKPRWPATRDNSIEANNNERFIADLRGVHRTLWLQGIPADPVTPKMEWSGYKLLVLPNVALMADATRERLERTLDENPDVHVLIEGSFGMYSDNGQSSYMPPEGFAERLGVRVADLSAISESDIAHGRNVLETLYGGVTISTPCGYAKLEPQGSTEAIASLGGDTVAVRSADGRVTWYGLTLSAGFGDVGVPVIVRAIAADAAVSAPIVVDGDPIVPIRRRSRQGGWLVFTQNLDRETATATLTPNWPISDVRDLLTGKSVDVESNGFSVSMEPWSVGVFLCDDA